MSAADLLQTINQLLYTSVFLITVVHAIRRPRRATIDAALLFGDFTVIIAVSFVVQVLDFPNTPWLSTLSGSCLMASCYLLLRLVDGFVHVPSIVMRSVEVILAAAILGLWILPTPLPLVLVLFYVVFYVGVEIYATVLVLQESRRAIGVTRRRLVAVAAASFFVAMVLVMAGVLAAFPGLAPLGQILNPALGLASGFGYLLGFATPMWLRRAWQEPEIRAFLSRATALTRLSQMDDIVSEIESGVAASLGTGRAGIGLWDENKQVLRWNTDGERSTTRSGELVSGRVFAEQRAIFTPDVIRDFPAASAEYQVRQVGAVMAAPITAGDRRLGVLVAFSQKAPVFAEDDMHLLQILADQAAVILESRTLIDQAARIAAESEANRLRDDFLSAAAHDLKTPLTSVVGRAQLLRARLDRLPDTPAAIIRDTDTIVSEGQRLRALVLDLLDASRIERGSLVGHRDTIDLAEIARTVCGRLESPRHTCEVISEEPVIGEFDAGRIAQLLDNFVENAVKYSPAGGPITISIWQARGLAHLTVADKGIGVPTSDLPHLFDRFRRASNVDDRQFAGLGLGLYICRGIVEGHSGHIWAESVHGEGTTFHVTLPLNLNMAGQREILETSPTF